MLTAPDFRLGDLAKILDGLEVLAAPAAVAFAASLEPRLAAAMLVTGSPRFTLEHVCDALPGIVDGRRAALWLVELACQVLSIDMKLPDVAATESGSYPNDSTPGLIVTADAAALGLPASLLHLIEDVATATGRRITITTTDGGPCHGIVDLASGVIALVPTMPCPGGWGRVLRHELGHVVDPRRYSPDREWFACAVADAVARANPRTWVELEPIVRRIDAIRSPAPSAADAFSDRYWSTLWFLYEARQWRPNPIQQEEIAA